jgi:outer membrane protein OmpA-like peptidoglycan-associated protein
MSATTPSKRPKRPKPPGRTRRSLLAWLLLGIAVSAGLLLYYDRGTDTTAALPEKTDEIAAIPVADPVETPPASTAPIAPEAREAATNAVPSQLQNRIQRLEDEIATLQEHRKRIDEVLLRQADLLAQERPSTAGPPAPVEPPRPIDRAGMDEALEGLGALPTERGHVVMLGESDLPFRIGEAEFASAPPDVLQAVAALLMRYAHLQASIEGHSDNKGSTARNQALTRERAQSVREALSAMGVDPERIAVEGYGGSRPITDNRTIAARERNRRIEIHLISEPSSTSAETPDTAGPHPGRVTP